MITCRQQHDQDQPAWQCGGDSGCARVDAASTAGDACGHRAGERLRADPAIRSKTETIVRFWWGSVRSRPSAPVPQTGALTGLRYAPTMRPDYS